MLDKYKHYFNIDPEYFPQVNEAIINENPEIWKKYYPHETFVKLIKDGVNVLSRKDKLSIWVEGAYGTGKSHAVLTFKKLLEASEEDTRTYFETYPEQLSNDLCNQLQQLKGTGQKILTVHRYGSSNINGDGSLIFALQESIVHALKENGIEHTGGNALRDATVQWLSQPWAKNAFNDLITEQYSDLFGGDDVDMILEKLQSFTGNALVTLMNKITKVGEEQQFKALSLDVNGLKEWIVELIHEQNLKAIVFIWDEFTNYFENNLKSLTGFQAIVEISATEPFYMIIVTHKSAGLFNGTDKDQKRILDRFVKPTCMITLPENMAFRLMAAAMIKTKDPVVLEDWNDTANELYDLTRESRELVMKKAKIQDNELRNILPIHPYAALLLKHISSAFDSNQRSMFDFIKNDRGDEIKGFQWFINNRSPEDENPLLTVDMLWDFFYEKGKEYLSMDIRAILDCFIRATTKKLSAEEQTVLKTVLLLQAISQRVGDTVELFIPDAKNLSNAFEGTDIENSVARIAEKLCRDEILYKKPLGNNKTQFSALVNAGDASAIEKHKKEMEKKTTSALLAEGSISDSITLTGALKLRYVVRYASTTDFKAVIGKLRNEASQNTGKIVTVVTVAKNEAESAELAKLIQEALSDSSFDIIFIDASSTTLGLEPMAQYSEAMANSLYQRGKDNALADQYEQNAKDILLKWNDTITKGTFMISYEKDGQVQKNSVVTVENLSSELANINRARYPYSLETGTTVIDTMWVPTLVKAGIECGANQELKSSYKSSNPNTKLETYIGSEACQQEESDKPYWESNATLLISRVKIKAMEVADEYFQRDGRVSIAQIYNALKEAPFGFLPCNLTGFVMGFILKEYVDGAYSWSDGLTTETLTINKLKEIVEEVISMQITANPRYRDKFIVMVSENEKAFNEASAEIFQVPLEQCSSVEQTRDRIRNVLKKFPFPIWCLKYAMKKDELKTDIAQIEKTIQLFSGIANNGNLATGQSDNDIAMSIGEICLKTPDIIGDMKTIFTDEKCSEGMMKFLSTFEDGILPKLAEEVDENNRYVLVLKSKFDTDAAKWVWNQETGEQKIKEVILEYRIILEGRGFLSTTTNFADTIKEWCSKCSYIRISHSVLKDSQGTVQQILPLLEALLKLSKSEQLPVSQREEFYQELSKGKEILDNLYRNQIEVFKEVCDYYLAHYDFTDEEIAKLYNSFPRESFTKEKAEYLNMVEQKITEFNASRGSAKLKELWKAKTDTISPADWSKKYKMPILIMMDENNLHKAQKVFLAINRVKPELSIINEAIEFLENASFVDDLASAEARDEAFRAHILKDYMTLLTDIDAVKERLCLDITSDCYDWFGTPELDRKLKKWLKQSIIKVPVIKLWKSLIIWMNPV